MHAWLGYTELGMKSEEAHILPRGALAIACEHDPDTIFNTLIHFLPTFFWYVYTTFLGR